MSGIASATLSSKALSSCVPILSTLPLFSSSVSDSSVELSGRTRGFLELVLQHLQSAGRVGLRIAQRLVEHVGEVQCVVDAEVEQRNILVEESERFELAEEDPTTPAAHR